MQKPKEELSKFYRGLRSRYINLREAIILHKYLSEDLSDGQIKTVNNFIGFYNIIHTSLNTYIIISLANFFYHKEKSNGEIDTKRSLHYYITLVKDNIKPLTKEHSKKERKKFCLELENQLLKVAKKEKIVENLLTNRNKFYAHFDPKYFTNEKKLRKDAPLFWEEIDELENVCKEILDWHSSTFGFSPIGDLVSHKTKEDAERILYELTFYKIFGDVLVSGEVAPELSEKLLDETDSEVSRNEIRPQALIQEQIDNRLIENSSLMEEVWDFLKDENSNKKN